MNDEQAEDDKEDRITVARRAVEHLDSLRVVMAASKTVRNTVERNHNMRLWWDQAEGIVRKYKGELR